MVPMRLRKAVKPRLVAAHDGHVGAERSQGLRGRQADAVGGARDQDVLALHEVPQTMCWCYAAFHLMEQPTEGTRSAGVLPAAIARIASTSSRRAVAGIGAVRPSSRRPRYLSLRCLS